MVSKSSVEEGKKKKEEDSNQTRLKKHPKRTAKVPKVLLPKAKPEPNWKNELMLLYWKWILTSVTLVSMLTAPHSAKHCYPRTPVLV